MILPITMEHYPQQVTARGAGTSGTVFLSDPPSAAQGRGESAGPLPMMLPDPAPVLTQVDGDTGLVLWRALRDVLAWTAATEAERADVFGPGAGLTRRASLERVALPTELAVPVALVVDLVANPTGASPLLVMHACLCVARHLCGQGAGLAALAFSQTAALACPNHPRPLLEVGRLLGPARAGEARAWLQRAAALAAERNDTEAGAEIHAELAALAFRRRDCRAARGHLVASARAARRGTGAP